MKNTATKAIKKVKLKEGKGNSENTIPETKGTCRNIFVEELKEIYFNEKHKCYPFL